MCVAIHPESAPYPVVEPYGKVSGCGCLASWVSVVPVMVPLSTGMETDPPEQMCKGSPQTKEATASAFRRSPCSLI